MNTDNFEELLVNNIIKSLDSEPHNWKTSIVGLKRIYDELAAIIENQILNWILYASY